MYLNAVVEVQSVITNTYEVYMRG